MDRSSCLASNAPLAMPIKEVTFTITKMTSLINHDHFNPDTQTYKTRHQEESIFTEKLKAGRG